MIEHRLADEEGMLALGARIAAGLSAGSVVYLQGELGAGKTTLARALVQALGHSGAVKSPTYTLVEPYELTGVTLYHFDLFRLDNPEELEFMGIRDYFCNKSLVLIEWPEKGTGFLPPADLVISIEIESAGRRVQLDSRSPLGMECLRRLRLSPVDYG